MKTIFTGVLGAALLLIASGCSKPAGNVATTTANAATTPAVAATRHLDQIGWFSGSVDEAFAHAKAEHKPIFLYWGAVWCPPCHEIKVTVFDTPEFVERSRLFVPVYLDGDTDNAQAIGERFGVVGYPTMIVFSPEGVEITRIPGGIDIQAYASVLDLTLQNVKPVSELLAAVVDDGASLSAADCSLVAFYSWGQNQTILQERNKEQVFRRLHDACPAELTVERSKLYMIYLDELIAVANNGENPASLSDEQKNEGLAEVNRFLDNYAAVKADIYSALFGGPAFVKALTAPGSVERAVLVKKYHGIFARVVDDESVFKTERLYTAIGKIRFERIDDDEAKLSEALKTEIRGLITWADKTTPDPYQRQTVINGASNVLAEAGMNDEARALLTAEIGKSKQPYYFMASLAEIEQEAGNNALALQWFKRAWDEAKGPATRFQWGNYYVGGLIDMTPEDTDAIRAATLSVIGEIGADGAFYQRNKMRLSQMAAKLMNWNADNQYDDSIDYIRENVQAMCARIPPGEPARETCERFLEPA